MRKKGEDERCGLVGGGDISLPTSAAPKTPRPRQQLLPSSSTSLPSSSFFLDLGTHDYGLSCVFKVFDTVKPIL